MHDCHSAAAALAAVPLGLAAVAVAHNRRLPAVGRNRWQQRALCMAVQRHSRPVRSRMFGSVHLAAAADKRSH